MYVRARNGRVLREGEELLHVHIETCAVSLSNPKRLIDSSVSMTSFLCSHPHAMKESCTIAAPNRHSLQSTRKELELALVDLQQS